MNENAPEPAAWTPQQRASYWEKLTETFPHIPQELEFAEGTQPGPFQKHGTSILSCKFSPDGKVAAAGGGRIPGCDDSIRIWDAASGKELLVCHGHVCGIYELAFDPRSGILASASEDYSVVLWNLEKRDAIFLVGGPPIVKGHVAFAARAPLIAIGETECYEEETSSVYVINLESGKEVFRRKLAGDQAISDLVISPQGSHITFAVGAFPGGGDTVVWNCNVATAEVNWKAELKDTTVYDLYASRDQEVLIASTNTDDGCHLDLIEAATGNWERKLSADGISLTVAVSPVEDLLACADEAGHVDLLAIPSLKQIKRLAEEGNDQSYSSAEFSPDGKQILLGDANGRIRVLER